MEPVKDLLIKSGVFLPLLNEIYDSFDFLPKEKFEQVNRHGLSKMHEFLDFKDIVRANVIANKRVNKISNDCIKKIVTKGLWASVPKLHFYINTCSVTRFFVPFDVLNTHEQTAEHKAGKTCCRKQGAGSGMIRFHGPHRDSWYDTSLNSMNIWAAITDVSKENGMLIYHEAYDKEINHKGVKVIQDKSFGKPETFELSAGSAILFNSHELHSTVLNTTKYTRVSITFRFSIEPPDFSNLIEGQRPIYYDSRFYKIPILNKLTRKTRRF